MRGLRKENGAETGPGPRCEPKMEEGGEADKDRAERKGVCGVIQKAEKGREQWTAIWVSHHLNMWPWPQTCF